jgi:hypothetical protein
MKAFLITSKECPPCTEMREHFADLIKDGEIQEKTLEDNGDEVTVLMTKHELSLPSLVILSEKGELILSI